MLISNFDRLPIKINHVWPMMTFCVLKWLKVQTQTSLQQCMNKIHHHVIQNWENANNPQIFLWNSFLWSVKTYIFCQVYSFFQFSCSNSNPFFAVVRMDVLMIRRWLNNLVPQIRPFHRAVVSIASMTHRYHYHLQTTMKLFFIKKIK